MTLVPVWVGLPLAAVEIAVFVKWLVPKLQQLASRRAYGRVIGVWMGFFVAWGVINLLFVGVPILGLTGALEQFLVVQIASLAVGYFMVLVSTRAHPASPKSG